MPAMKAKRRTVESPTLAKIRRVAERRQALWSKLPGLTATNRAEISKLTAQLEALWEQHRIALAKPHPAPRVRPRRATPSTRRSSAA